MMNIETFEVEIEHEGERLDKYLSMIFDEAASARGLTPQSRSFFQKIIKDGQVFVNDTAQKANYRLKAEDFVCVTGRKGLLMFWRLSEKMI